ncbi:MAG: GNAT family N-acetyltransferase [Actinobacteria bacterium]|nr:GNAT family N-acetyltransferase [Actinomycetota bacterium]
MDTLVGATVRLEPLAPHHSAGLFSALGNDDEAWRWMLVETPRCLDDMQRLVGSYLEDMVRGDREPYAVINIPNGEVVGTTSFMDISNSNRTREIGSTIYGRAFWRSRVNSETKFLLLTHAFEVKESNRVFLKTDHLNLRSQVAIERIGGVREGTLRAHRIRKDGTLRDSVYYSILKPEWPQVKAKLQGFLA